MIRQTLLAGLTACVLAGCANSNQNAILDPHYKSGQYQSINQTVALSVVDQRNASPTIFVNKDGSTQQLSTAQLEQKITQLMSEALQTNGAQVSAMGAMKFDVAIHTLKADVEQGTFEHTSTANAALQVFVSKGGSKFNKMYKGQSEFKGPFGFDQAKVEAQLNKLLEQLSARIMSDPELNQFIN